MLSRLRAAGGDERGVTLMETLVVITLMGVIGSIVTTSLVRGMQASAATQSRVEALAELQKSVDRMTRELRAAAPVQIAEPNRASVVVFRNNFTQQMRYTYQYCPTQQRLHVLAEGPFATPAPPAKVAPGLVTPPALLACATTTAPYLIDRVTNASTQPVFEYRTAAGAVTAVPSQIRQIKVRVQRSLPTQPAITVQTDVRLRNVR